MTVYVTDLLPGDEVIGYMRPGLPLRRTRRPRDGMVYRQVPSRPVTARTGDLTRFTGVVLVNNTATGVLTVATTALDPMRIAVSDESLPADIHYTALRRLQVLSKHHIEGRDDMYKSRPTSTEGLGTQTKAYRTLTEVVL